VEEDSGDVIGLPGGDFGGLLVLLVPRKDRNGVPIFGRKELRLGDDSDEREPDVDANDGSAETSLYPDFSEIPRNSLILPYLV
jgi:hypothetical protein